MFAERLRELRTSNGYSMHQLVDLYNRRFHGKMNKSTLSRYENKLQEPMYTVVKNLAELFSVSTDYLLGNVNDPFFYLDNARIIEEINSYEGYVPALTPSAYRIARAYDVAPAATRRIVEVALEPYVSAALRVSTSPDEQSCGPYLKEECSKHDAALPLELSDHRSAVPLPLHLLPASAGSGEFLDSNDFELVNVGPEVPLSAHYGVRISGDSMEPDYPDGYIAWAKRTVRVEEGQVGIFILNGEGYIKKWSRGRLMSLNPAYKPIVIHPDDDLSTRGLVVAVTENTYQ